MKDWIQGGYEGSQPSCQDSEVDVAQQRPLPAAEPAKQGADGASRGTLAHVYVTKAFFLSLQE